MKPKLIYFTPAAVWSIIIFILLVMPAADIPASPFFELVHFDKWVHAGLFGMLTMLICFPFFRSKYASSKLFWRIAAAALAYGIIMEFVQKLTPDRDFDVWDMVADGVGAVIACLLVNIIYKRFKRKQEASL